MKHPSDVDFEWTNNNTAHLAIMFSETQAGIRWVLNYFAEVYKHLSIGDYDLEPIIAHFTEAMSKGVKEDVKYWGKSPDIDYRQLFFFWYESNSEMKHDYKDGKFDLEAYKKSNE